VRTLFLAALAAALALSAGAQPGLPEADPAAPLGLGLAVVRVTDAPPPLRFYAHPALAELPSGVPVGSATVADSVTFVPGRGRASLGSGPPWLLPEVIDAERGHLAFRVRTLTPEWVEAVANRADGRTVWLRRDRVEVAAWPDVLLRSLVTLPDPEANPLRERPHDEASVLATTPPDWLLRPLAVRGAWLQVSTLGLADRIPPAGWVRWTGGDRLLVGGIGHE
jgi:hypothetical protein